MDERIVVTYRTPGLSEAIQELPAAWEVWVNPNQKPLTKGELEHQLRSATGVLIVGDRITAEGLSCASRLRAISTYGVGVDHIDLEAAACRNVAVGNLPHQVTHSTAELAVGLMLACCRRIAAADSELRRLQPYESTPTYFMGRNLAGKTLGIIGFGRIGQQVARLAKAFGMRVVYHDPRRCLDAEEESGARYTSMDALLQEADIVSLHAPASPETQHLLGRRQFTLMKEGAVLINTARGSLVDEDALVEALQTKLFAAGLDVYENEPLIHPELIRMSHVVLTPHVGTAALETRVSMTKAWVETLKNLLLAEGNVSRVV